MSILRKAFKIFNGSSWDEYHLKTDSKQVVHTKADGTDTTVEEQLLALNSTLTTLSANLGSNAGVSAKCFYNSFICEVRIEGNTTTTFPNWGGYRLGILPEKARPKQNIVEYLYESFYLEIGTDGSVNLKVSNSMPANISVFGSKTFFLA